MPVTDYVPRDFVETPEGLAFAVVAPGVERGRVLAFLRYVRTGRRLHKLGSAAARQLVRRSYPPYLFRSQWHDVTLHGIPLARVRRHLLPHLRARQLLQTSPRDRIERTAVYFLRLLAANGIAAEQLGLTGSLLLGAQHEDSDIDVVVRDRHQFEQTRAAIRTLLHERQVKPLSEQFWRSAYLRRACSLSYEQYVWHERRKHNKLSINGIKIDVSQAVRDRLPQRTCCRKLGRVQLTAPVVNDAFAFDYPAVWDIDSDVAARVVSWTPTYTGQAFRGEMIRVHGWLEEIGAGSRQVVVGTSREAEGELIRVIERE